MIGKILIFPVIQVKLDRALWILGLSRALQNNIDVGNVYRYQSIPSYLTTKSLPSSFSISNYWRSYWAYTCPSGSTACYIPGMM